MKLSVDLSSELLEDSSCLSILLEESASLVFFETDVEGCLESTVVFVAESATINLDNGISRRNSFASEEGIAISGVLAFQYKIE